MHLTIDGRGVTARRGETILDAARRAGVHIPTLCHDRKLEPYASCWICVVKVKGERRFRPACSTPAVEGMEVVTLDDEIRAARRLCLELLLSDHCGDCVPPCRLACPAGCDARGYLGFISQRRYGDALALVRETVPLPATIGRICPHPCEDACRRSIVDEPASICALKRFVAERAEEEPLPSTKPSTGRRVAVVGSGPAGLSAAWFLLLEGHGVTIFEARPMPGGMLRYGIPEYRLPKAVLDAEIDAIRRLGAEIRCGVRVGAEHGIRLLLAGGYDAVLVAAGAQRSRPMGIPGEALPGVLGGVDLLAAVAGGASPALGDEVVVVGGGDTAIDAARTARRLGARRVTIAYRRSREEMPATPGEIAAAEEEGVELRFLTLPIAIRQAGGRLEIDCRRMALGPPDESGRRRPVPVEGGVHTLAADRVVMAIGQSVDASVLDGSEIAPAASGLVPADAGTFETGLPGVFAAGDCVTGPDIAIAAVAAGRRAAFAIDAWLRTGAAAALPPLRSPARRNNEEVDPGDYADEPRVGRMGVCRPGARERTADFREVEATAPEEDAVREAYRCLSCGCERADDCTLRDLARDYGVEQNRFGSPPKRWQIDDRHPWIVRDPDKCIKCARCIRVCIEVQGIGAWGYVGRGLGMQVAPPFDGPLQDTDCETCGQCLTACPTGALVARRAAVRVPAPSAPTETTCGRCGDGCRVAVRTAGNLIDSVRPADDENLCEKGRFGCGGLSSGERILSPFLGRGASSRPAAWREAAEAARAGLGGVEPRRIAVFVSPRITNEEAFEAQRLARAVLNTNNLYPAAGAIFTPQLFRELGRVVSPWGPVEIEKSDAIAVVGASLVDSNRVAALSVVAARRRAARIIVVGREQTKLDRIAAENVRVPPDRFAAYGARLASLFRGAKRPAIVFTRDALPAATLRALHRLAARTGAGIVSLCAEANGQGLLDAGVSPFVLPGQRPIAAPRARRLVERESGIRVPPRPGMGRAALLAAMRRGRIRAALFLGGAVPDEDRELAKALRGVPFVLMQALERSPLTRRAHLLLPAASWAESRGTFTRCDGTALPVRPVLPPLCGYTNAEIWRLLFAHAPAAG
ncbi:MAG TPA: FAD-dependent oxidoreductase [bacterium]|nr:FAD-dependent oxidoreductase [Chlamydiota bacterium]HOE26665.1 FAD-dependent oxidoreductase [bacterium]